jgi:hypothetical protein
MAMPRAWLASDVVSAKPEEILRAIKTSILPDGGSFNPATTALIESPITSKRRHERAIGGRRSDAHPCLLEPNPDFTGTDTFSGTIIFIDGLARKFEVKVSVD